MRAHVWAAALVMALAFSLQTPAAPVGFAASASQTTASSTASFFTKLTLTSIVTPTNKLFSFFPSMPSIDSPTGFGTTATIPLTNGQANKAYFKMFGLQYAPRAQ